RLVLGREEQVVDRLLGQVAERGLRVPAVGGEACLGDLLAPARGGGHGRAWHRRAGHDALALVRQDELGIDLQSRAEAGARRAGAVRRVEREAAWLELIDRRAVVGARVALGEAPLFELGWLALARHRGDEHHTLASPARALEPGGR